MPSAALMVLCCALAQRSPAVAALRDGVALNATVYRPKGPHERSPCVFTLTPSIGDSYHDRGMYFAAHCLPFLLVDVRGRGRAIAKYHPPHLATIVPAAAAFPSSL